MVIGVLQLHLLIRDAASLKDKRRIVKGLLDRIRDRFNVSASEVDAQDLRQTAMLGVTLATNERAFADQVMAKVVDLVRHTPGAELVDYETEIL
jgi:uncharacterized protein YlxP (DUF503 family)